MASRVSTGFYGGLPIHVSQPDRVPTTDRGNISRKYLFYLREAFDMVLALALFRARVSPFDIKAALLAKHAQHVVLIHFPIALFVTAVAFDVIAHWTKRRALAEAAYFNLLVAAISTAPVIATGILAWQFQLEGQRLKGVLLLHLVLACVSGGMMGLAWWVHFRGRKQAEDLPSYRFAVEGLAAAIVVLTAHLGGFLSGVNRPG
jgi:uncharacterized membrane protein